MLTSRNNSDIITLVNTNLIVRVVIEVPKKLNKKQKDALLSFEKELTPSNYEKRTSFFDKIKKFGDDLKKNFQ